MKKHFLVMVLTMVTLLALTSCGNNSQEDSGNTNVATSQENSAGNQTDAGKGNGSGAAVSKDGKVLVAYFAVAENSDVDAISSASVSDVNGEKKGRMTALAEMIQEKTGGELFQSRLQ